MKFKFIGALFLFLLPLVLEGQAGREVPVTLQTPYNTVYVHLYYLQEDSYQPAVAARTLYGVADSSLAVRLAVQLKQVLDGKGLRVQLNTLPQEADYVDSVSNKNIYFLFPQELPSVYLERLDGRWYYSRETVAQIPALHSEVFPFGSDILLNLLPKTSQNKFLGLKVWQWLGLALLLLLAGIFHFILSWLLPPLLRRLGGNKAFRSLLQSGLIRKIARYTSVFIILRLLLLFLPTLQLPIEASSFAVTVIKVLSMIMVMLIALRIVDILVVYFDRRTRETENRLDEQMVPILKGILQVVIFVAGLLQILSILNVNVTALIAGISIGAVAIGLAAKDTVANVFGSLMIFLDKPFQVGDWIHYAGIDGTVEQVGIRATRVRTFANSLVYIPNAALTNSAIDNYGLRVFRRFKTTIAITYDTPPAIIEKFVEGLEQIVVNHPRTRKDYFEIHLNDFGDHSLNILFYIFFDVPSWSDELRGRQEVMLAVINLAAAMGVRFAFPTSTIQIEEMPGHTSLAPTYEKDPGHLDQLLQEFMEEYRKRYQGG
jgi:MscS family membrane protein